MLQSLRTGSKSPFMKVFLVFLAGGFAIWGIGDVSNGLFGPGDKAIKAGSQSVSSLEVAQEFDFIRRAQYNGISTGDAIQFGLLNDVISRMARTTLFEAEADRLNIVSTREMQKTALLRQTAFQDETGAFSQGRFLRALSQAGLSEDAYLQQLDKTILSQQIADTVSMGAKYPERISKEFAEYELERRTAQLISFDINPEEQPVPQDNELREWFDANSDAYDATELRDLRYLLISPEALIDEVEVTDNEMREAFEQRGDEFATPERRVVRQMVFDTAEQALAARNAIDSGTDFTEVANNLLGLTQEDIFLGDVTYNDVDAIMADAIFNAEAGELIGPTESLFGHNLAIVDVIILGSSDSFEDVKEEIETTLKNENAIDLVYDKLNTIEDALGTGATLQEVASANGIEIKTIIGVDQQGNNIDGNPFLGSEGDIISLAEFLETSWSTELGEISTVVDAGNDSYFVVEPTAESEARKRTFEEVRKRVLADYNLKNAIKAAEAKAKSHLRIGPSIFNDTPATTPFRRSAVGLDDANARLIAQTVFEQPVDAAMIVETGSEILIVRTAEILPATETEVTDTATFYSSQLNQSASQNISEALSARLSESHKLELYPGMVQQLLLGQSN
ncbi:MAG: SurA N-terminal domain-containing protein [Alphaproteobacteria bacterium]